MTVSLLEPLVATGQNPRQAPACSVIVPLLGPAEGLERCLSALAAQETGSPRFEILLVAPRSCTGHERAVRQWQAGHPEIELQLLWVEDDNAATAYNAGAHAAQGEYLLFTTTKCAPLPGWIATLTRPFTETGGEPAEGQGMVVGVKGTYFSCQSGITARLVQAEYEERYRRLAGQRWIDFIDTYSAAYRRTIFLQNGGFDTLLAACQDQELSFRLAEKGYRLVFAPDARVDHLHETTLAAYMQRKTVIGFWKSLLTRLHPDRMVNDSHTPQIVKLQVVLAALMAAGLATGLAGSLWPALAAGWWLAGGALLLFLVTTAPFLAGLSEPAPALVAAAPIFLMGRALALGSGYLAGTVHFAGLLPGERRPIIPAWQRVVKRLLDILGALVGLLLTLPLVALAALAIKLDSPGPIFFYQVRVGENGRPFRIVKLRTMVADAEKRLDSLVKIDELKEPVFKIRNDPRVTRVGGWLRSSSIDEIPQFFNVLVGEMSLVGPRPEEARIVALYNDYQRKRLAVKPGLTGPMQVAGRGELSLNERLRLELDYIDHYSLLRDIQILLQTVPAIMRKRGAF